MDEMVLVGIDGGASKVLLHEVKLQHDPLQFVPCEPVVEISYDTSKHFDVDFAPVPLAEQLDEHRGGNPRQKPAEERCHAEAAADEQAEAQHQLAKRQIDLDAQQVQCDRG